MVDGHELSLEKFLPDRQHTMSITVISHSDKTVPKYNIRSSLTLTHTESCIKLHSLSLDWPPTDSHAFALIFYKNRNVLVTNTFTLSCYCR